MSEVQNVAESKTLVFNPGGFILKVIFALAVPIMTTGNMENVGFFSKIIGFAFFALLMYGIATVFGFAVRATGNYLIGLVVFGILLAIFFVVLDKIEKALSVFGGAGTVIAELLVIALLVWPVVTDVKKAMLYFKHTV